MEFMWKKIREEKGVNQREFGEKFGYSARRISQYECGYRKMPDKLQIEYLKLRNSNEDKILIEYLERKVKLYDRG